MSVSLFVLLFVLTLLLVIIILSRTQRSHIMIRLSWIVVSIVGLFITSINAIYAVQLLQQPKVIIIQKDHNILPSYPQIDPKRKRKT